MSGFSVLFTFLAGANLGAAIATSEKLSPAAVRGFVWLEAVLLLGAIALAKYGR